MFIWKIGFFNIICDFDKYIRLKNDLVLEWLSSSISNGADIFTLIS